MHRQLQQWITILIIQLPIKLCGMIKARANRDEMELQPIMTHETVGIDHQVCKKILLMTYQTSYQLSFDMDSCACYLEDFVEGDILAPLPPCGHTFHKDCIFLYLHGANICPFCRQTISFLDEDMSLFLF